MLENKSQALVALQPKPNPHPAEMSFGTRLKQARLAAKPKITLAMIAEELGVTLQAVSAWERDKNKPGTQHLNVLATYLNTTTDWLLEKKSYSVARESHELNKVEDSTKSLIAIQPQISPMSGAGPTTINETPAYGERDLPRYGTTPKGKGVVALADVDYDQRPEYLLNVKKAYAVIVPDDSMADRLEADFVAYVDPSKAPKPNKICVFRSKLTPQGETLICIRRLKSQSDDAWVVEQNRPIKKSYSLKKSDWPECHVVVGSHWRD